MHNRTAELLPPTPVKQAFRNHPVLPDDIQRGMAVFVRLDIAAQQAPESDGPTLEQTAQGLYYLIDRALAHPKCRTRRGRAGLVNPEEDMQPYLLGAARVLELVQRTTPASSALETAAKNARSRLLLHNLKFVTRISFAYKDLLEDDVLVQEGVVGLRRAIEKYDPTRAATLLTFANKEIRKAIRDAIIKSPPLLSAGDNDMERMALLERTKRYLKEAGEEETVEKLAEWSGLSTEKVKELEGSKRYFSTSRQHGVSLDDMPGDTTTTYAEILGAQAASVEDIVVEKMSIEERLAEVYGKLNELEKRFIRLRFGVRSADEVAELLDMKVHEAYKVERSILQKLGLGPQDLQRLDEEVAALPRRPVTEEEKKACALYAHGDGESMKSIAKLLGRSSDWVEIILKGIPLKPKPYKPCLLASPWADQLTPQQRHIAELYDSGLGLAEISRKLGTTRPSTVALIQKIREIATDPSTLPPAELKFTDQEERLIHLREQGLGGAALRVALSLTVGQLWKLNHRVAVKRVWQERMATLKEGVPPRP